jgi:proteasome activator subunit 4
MTSHEKLADLMMDLDKGKEMSRATSPGGNSSEPDNRNQTRRRPRTYPYTETLPYDVEEEATRYENLETIIKHIYLYVEAGDFAVGVIHWTRELKSWLSLKFDLTIELRIKLVKLYYELALAPGLDNDVSERFANTFMVLTKKKHYLRPIKDLALDWRPLFRELKPFVLPTEAGLVQTQLIKKSHRTLTKMATFARLYFDPMEIPPMLEEFLPYFNTSFAEGAFVVVGLLNLFLPTLAPFEAQENLMPQYNLPTLFHLWSLINRSRAFDDMFIDLFSRMSRDTLQSRQVPISAYGIFDKDQSALIFTAILRLLDVPVGQASSPYGAHVDESMALGALLMRDQKKSPIAHSIARFIVMSLTPACLDEPDSILGNLEGLMQAIEVYFHPSNSGAWTKPLSQVVYYLADFFVMRWNRERSGEMDTPPERRLNDEIKRRFVLCLRDATLLGIYSKSGTAMNFFQAVLANLAFLEPHLILPSALQRIYPSMQGLVEVHRTTSSLRALQVLSRTIVCTKGFRCHATSLLGLALPGIDANDLDKTLYTLAFLSAICYYVPFHDLTKGDDRVQGSYLAMDWITSEVDRMEQGGAELEVDYANDLSNEDEEMILRSSTASFSEFVSSFLGKIFTLLENLPDASRLRSNSPEEGVINTLPSSFTPLLASLSPELYDLALSKVADFVGSHVIHQARDAMGFICMSLAKIDPEKALRRLLPMLMASIRTEIDENGAASSRSTGSEVLPRDRGLVWHLTMLSLTISHAGEYLLPYKQELSDILQYLQENCKGVATTHVSTFIHHLLRSLVVTYTRDFDNFEPGSMENGPGPADWGRSARPEDLHIKWHVPSEVEIKFALEIYKTQGENMMSQLTSLMDGSSPIKREGRSIEWSDEVSKNLVGLRCILTGAAVLFDVSRGTQIDTDGDIDSDDTKHEDDRMDVSNEAADEELVSATDEETLRPTFKYVHGYVLERDEQVYTEVHAVREHIGEVLHQVHEFLAKHQEDDVSCFTPLYLVCKSWFVDVGIERTSHQLDRAIRLLKGEQAPFKMSGMHKPYPRALLVRRAHVYHLQRVRHNATPRIPSDLETQLLLDLAQSSVSPYTDVRRVAQSAIESAVKVIVGARAIVIAPVLDALETGVKQSNFSQIKGGIYTLIYGTMSKTVKRNWKFAPRLIKTFLAACDVDKPSIQKLTTGATMHMMEYGRRRERMVIIDKDIVRTIAPNDDLSAQISKKKDRLTKKNEAVESRKTELADELTDLISSSHWKTASRILALVVTLGYRFDSLVSDKLVDLIANGAIDQHPGLRGMYGNTFTALYGLIYTRMSYGHKYENYVLEKQNNPGKIEVMVDQENPNWTAEHLASFAQPEAEYYVDHEYPGWLVWGKSIPAYKANMSDIDRLDDVEKRVASRIGQVQTREWFAKFFTYLLQEPRDATDRFRIPVAILLGYAFDYMHQGYTAATFDEIKDEIIKMYGDGDDKHKHRATAEVLGGLLTSVEKKSTERRNEVWDFCMSLVLKIFNDGLTPENSSYWTTFLHLTLQGKDPRRAWPLFEWLSQFRLDMSSNSAFKESSKITLLFQAISACGWHYRLEEPILADFLTHIDHPYKSVRESMGHTLAAIHRTRYHESYKDVDTLLRSQREASSIGTRPYPTTPEFKATIHGLFNRIEEWRKERPTGQPTPSPYTQGSKTVLLWLDSTIASYECSQLYEFFPGVFLEPLLHMMDVREDQELLSLAGHVYRHMPNVPHRTGEDSEMISALIRIGTTSQFWHHRLRTLLNMQVIYFRRLFLIADDKRRALVDCCVTMLKDNQLEVRKGAALTLSGMIQCSHTSLRNQLVKELNENFTAMLIDNPLPKKPRGGRLGGAGSVQSSGTSTPTPEQNKLVITRHAAVLGLGALVQAFPYTSPPPTWVPEVLATMANKANADPGIVGKEVKTILSHFKKTRQDTWAIDLKVSLNFLSVTVTPC